MHATPSHGLTETTTNEVANGGRVWMPRDFTADQKQAVKRFWVSAIMALTTAILTLGQAYVFGQLKKEYGDGLITTALVVGMILPGLASVATYIAIMMTPVILLPKGKRKVFIWLIQWIPNLFAITLIAGAITTVARLYVQ